MGRDYIEVIGKIWMPPVMAATEYQLDGYSVALIEEQEGATLRDKVDAWLSTHSGDFQEVKDFRASIGDQEVPWQDEESELIFNDCMYPEVDDSDAY